MYRTHVLTVSESFLGRLGNFLVSLGNNSPELSTTFFWAVLDIKYYCTLTVLTKILFVTAQNILFWAV